MITIESMMSIEKEALPEAAAGLSQDDIPRLVEWLSLKDDSVRYQAFLLLQNRSASFDDVYPYWDILRSKLKSGNSYQRSIGLMLIAENTKWDAENRMENTIDDYLERLNDEKPITIRQCVQSLAGVVPCKPGLNGRIADRLIAFDFTAIKQTMRKSILLDILNILLLIRKTLQKDGIESFIQAALAGEILDKKSKKQIEALL